MEPNSSKKSKLKERSGKIIQRLSSTRKKRLDVGDSSQLDRVSASSESATSNQDLTSETLEGSTSSAVFTEPEMTSSKLLQSEAVLTHLPKHSDGSPAEVPAGSSGQGSVEIIETYISTPPGLSEDMKVVKEDHLTAELHIQRVSRETSRSSSRANSRPGSRPSSRPPSKMLSRAYSRGSLNEDAPPVRNSHSYSTFFSSTNLQKLSSDANTALLSRHASALALNGEAPESPHLLYRTGSKLWEESRETKGQSWLSLRQTADPSSSSDEDEPSEATAQSGGRPAYHRAYTSQKLESDYEDDELVLHFTPRADTVPINTENASDSTTAGTVVLRAVDWLLGIKQESATGLTDALQPETSHVLTKHEKRLQRDGDQVAPVDVAWVLAVIGSYGFF